MRITGIVRRGRLSGGGTAAAIKNAVSFALGGWDTSTNLATANPGGIAGSALAGVSVVVAFFLHAVPATVQVLATRVSGNTGWTVRTNGSSFQCISSNGAAQAIAPVRTLVAGDVGKFHVAALTHDLAAVFDFFDRVQVGTSSALAGYAAAATRTAMGISSAGNTQPATDFSILGVAGRDSPLSLADYQTICDATKAAGQLSLGGITMEHMWRAPQTPNVPSTLTDELDSSNMTFVAGSAANLVSARLARSWGF
jgi:hypothetical protein